MEITVNNKKYDLRFGISFNHNLDLMYQQEVDGVAFGMGLDMAYVYLQTENVTAVFNVIKAAMSHLKKKPKAEEIESFIEERAIEDNGLDKLCKELIEEMKDSPFLKSKIKKMETQQKKNLKG